ncbi:hypothetical protein L6164_024041 [Bauhinia variegata]|uniref:Uncharacterized protein n=1 Tax=Bauhinia variegata TaxID=167791 RepID=A0ACB9LXT2_BAUVA|nr:hypothetical protein L6164_024041 [Bauhinia variegata]
MVKGKQQVKVCKICAGKNHSIDECPNIQDEEEQANVVNGNPGLIDFGASISLMPASIYHSLNLGSLKETSVVIQLADRSNTYLEGILEDILVQVNKLIFLADFYVLDMENYHSPKSTPLLLRRSFLKTSRTKIDVAKGTLSMEFDHVVIKFNIYDVM